MEGEVTKMVRLLVTFFYVCLGEVANPVRLLIHVRHLIQPLRYQKIDTRTWDVVAFYLP